MGELRILKKTTQFRARVSTCRALCSGCDIPCLMRLQCKDILPGSTTLPCRCPSQETLQYGQIRKQNLTPGHSLAHGAIDWLLAITPLATCMPARHGISESFQELHIRGPITECFDQPMNPLLLFIPTEYGANRTLAKIQQSLAIQVEMLCELQVFV